MEIVETVLIGVLVLVALALTGLILLQQGRGASVGAAFGSGSANAVFGAQGSFSFIARATTWLSVAFFAIALSLAWVAKTRFAEGDLVPVSDVPGLAETPAVGEAPAAPAAGDVPPAPADMAPATDVPASPPSSPAPTESAGAAGAAPAGDVPAPPASP
jgi:preprotein translocase subunit SecG